MKVGPLGYRVAYELPQGVDASISFYFVSDAKGVEAKITIDGVNQFPSAEHMLLEAERLTNDSQFTAVAADWRLMSRAEVLKYRQGNQEEERGANHDHQNVGSDEAADR